jgi:1-acyl-sn-glycerol-3-phosphate acyltransferase
VVYNANRAQPPLSFIPADFDRRVLAVVRWGLPYWMKRQEKIQRVEVANIEPLVHQFKAFQEQQIRLIIAFRHPSPSDSFCIGHLLWHDLPRHARQMGIKLASPTHAHFIYDRGIPLWAGQWVGWLYSKLGGTPIQRGKVDRQGLRAARQLFAQGLYPLAAAPEGGNNGHSEIVSPLEPGVAQLGFWCVEDMHQAQRNEPVVILPLGIAYQYVIPPWPQLDTLLDQLEQASGITPDQALPMVPATWDTPPPDDSPAMEQRYGRLFRLGQHLLRQMEHYYQTVYGLVVPDPAEASASSLSAQAQLGQRLQNLMDTALTVAESYFQLTPRGNYIDRCRRIEQAGWENIFQAGLADGQAMSAVERGLADRIAEEAGLRMWHMRLVENFVAVTGQYVKQRPSAERFAETLLILRDTITLIEGENPFPRPKLGPQIARLTVGEPLSVSDRWQAYRQSRKQAVTNLTADIQSALEAMIVEPAWSEKTL